MLLDLLHDGGRLKVRSDYFRVRIKEKVIKKGIFKREIVGKSYKVHIANEDEAWCSSSFNNIENAITLKDYIVDKLDNLNPYKSLIDIRNIERSLYKLEREDII